MTLETSATIITALAQTVDDAPAPRLSRQTTRAHDTERIDLIMILPIIGRLSWNSFWLGTTAASIGAAIVRPLLVGTVRAGYEVADVANDAWTQAKAEVDSVKREALTARESGRMATEIQQLRDEVAALRTQLAKKA